MQRIREELRVVQSALRLSTRRKHVFRSAIRRARKIFFAKRVGRNLNAIRQFARDEESSSTTFPNNWLKPL
jgi:hypothetical protein